MTRREMFTEWRRGCLCGTWFRNCLRCNWSFLLALGPEVVYTLAIVGVVVVLALGAWMWVGLGS